MFSMANALFHLRFLVLNSNSEHAKLMYRAPGRDTHQSVVEILDEILNRLDSLEKTLTTLEETN